MLKKGHGGRRSSGTVGTIYYTAVTLVISGQIPAGTLPVSPAQPSEMSVRSSDVLTV